MNRLADEMERALRADGEKLRGLTGEDHGPFEALVFQTGDKVRKIGGDYTFEGAVVSVFAKLSGVPRLVVEDDRGVLFIFNEKQLARI